MSKSGYKPKIELVGFKHKVSEIDGSLITYKCPVLKTEVGELICDLPTEENPVTMTYGACGWKLSNGCPIGKEEYLGKKEGFVTIFLIYHEDKIHQLIICTPDIESSPLYSSLSFAKIEDEKVSSGGIR